jgi:hypothetical protein
MPALSRKQLASIWRPVGPKYITTVPWVANTNPTVVQSVDLTTPIRGIRIVFKGRITVATANYTSVNPENILNLISNIQITGTNRRQGGNVTPVFGDLAALFGFSNLTAKRAGMIQVNGVLARELGIPCTLVNFQTGTALFPGTTAGSPYDFIIELEIPFAPFGSLGAFQAGFIMRAEEWKDSLTFKFSFPAVPDNAANPLGLSAATTVTTFAGFGGGGTPTVDVYSLPVIMGDARNLVVPGVLNRSTQPVGAPVQTTGNNIELLRLQKQPTPRLYVKVGVAAAQPVFTSLLDTAITAIGLQVGTDRNVRDVLDWFAHRVEAVEHYDCNPIQGYIVLDFMQGDTPDGAYPADSLGDGAIFRVVANVTGGANQAALILQEQILQRPEGALYGV